MNRNKLLVAVISFTFVILGNVAVADEIFKCKQPGGTFSYQDEPCDNGAREYKYLQKPTVKLELPAIYKSSYNSSSDFEGLSPEKVAQSRCLKLCYKQAMTCGLRCASLHKNMSSAKPCFLQCRSGSRFCVQTCTLR